MARKTRNRNFEEMLDALKTRGFDLTPFAGIPDGMQVSKSGIAAVLLPGVTDARWESGGVRLAVTPGPMIRDQIARLVDRGYQKFFRISQFELPATASQLQAVHAFEEELNQVTGALGLYNESLGTTSDVCLYDRVRGREAPQPKANRPWELSGGH